MKHEKNIDKFDDDLETQKISLSLGEIASVLKPLNNIPESKIIHLPSKINQQKTTTTLLITTTTTPLFTTSLEPKNLFQTEKWQEMNSQKKPIITTTTLKPFIETTTVLKFFKTTTDYSKFKTNDMDPLKNKILSTPELQDKKRIFYDYSKHNRIQRPVRVQIFNAISNFLFKFWQKTRFKNYDY